MHLESGLTSQSDPRVLEVPLLKNRFLRPFAARRIWSDSRLHRPDLLHVLHDEMVDVALALSETGQVPYVQTVAGFATVERGLRLSRKWCRRLIAAGPDLAEELAVCAWRSARGHRSHSTGNHGTARAFAEAGGAGQFP